MKYLLTLCFACLFLLNGHTQIHPQRAVVRLDTFANAVSGNLIIPITNPEPFLAYALVWRGEASPLQIRFSSDGSTWSDWQVVQEDGHTEQSADRHVSELYFTSKQHHFFQVLHANVDTEIHFYSPDDTPEISVQNVEPRSNECACAQPTYQNRAAWCPNGNCPPNPAPSVTSVTHLIVHHSAGTNESSDWAAMVRSIWNFHVNVNGWSDVGYNWLIDPNGVVYEGRGDNILGAHFCGTNSGTMGVCVLGDFTNIEPTEAAKNSLVALLAWKSCDRNIDPLGSAFHAASSRNLQNISGHRDGCSTECPGNVLYPLLGSIRQGVVDFIANNCSIATAVKPVLALDAVQLYPNPAEELLYFAFKSEWNGRFMLSILDMTGRRLQTLVNEKDQEQMHQRISIASLPAGVYTLVLKHDQGAAVFKFVKN